MKLTITSLELRSPLRFFALSMYAMNIMKQLRASGCVKMKKSGIWTKHYTMSLWRNEADLKAFARSGAHLEAMKKSASLAREIRTLTIDADTLPGWKEAKALLKERGRVIKY